MSNAALEFVERHPLAIAGGVLVIGVAYVLLSGSGSTAQAATSNAVDPNVLSAQVQLANTQAQLQGQTAQINGQLQQTQIQAAAAQTQETLQAQVAALQTAASLQSTQAQVSGQVQINASNDQTSQANTAATTSAAVSQTALQTAALVQQQSIESAYNFLTAQAQGADNVQIVGLNDQTQQALASINGQVQITQANDQLGAIKAIAGAQEASSLGGGVLGLAGKALSVFGGSSVFG
jgi:hypothetical protein